MRRIVGYDYLLGLLFIIGLSTISICNIGSCSREYYVTVLLPIVYFLGYSIWWIKSSKTAILIKKIIMGLFEIKLVLIPCLIMLNGGLSEQRFNSNIYGCITDAVIVQSIEYMVVLMFLIFSNWPIASMSDHNITNEDYFSDVSASKNIWRILGICIVLIAGVIIVYPSFLNRLRPIFFLNESAEILWKKRADIALNSLPSIIYYPINWMFVETRLALAYMIAMKIYNSRIRISDGLKIMISFLSTITILILIVPDDVATSIYAALSLFLLLYILYPFKRRQIGFVVGVVCVAVLVGAFLIMPSISGRGVSLNYVATKLNAYFSGYINTAASVHMNTYASSRLDMVVGDFFRSLPVVRGYFIRMPMSNELFNMALGYDTIYNSQIIPLEGQGYYYLWYFGTVLFTVVHMKLLKQFYCKMMGTHSTFSFYLYGVLTLLMTFGIVMYGEFLTFSLILAQIPLLLINRFFARRINNEGFDIS